MSHLKARPTVDVDFGRGKELRLHVPVGGQRVTFDILEESYWGGLPDDSTTLEQHSGKEAWWAARYADEIAIQGDWQETVYDNYMAHLRKFASYALTGQGNKRDKATKQDIHDTVFYLFSETRTEEQRARYIGFAFLGYMQELYDSRTAAHQLFNSNREVYNARYCAFHAELFAYRDEAGQPVWVETMIRQRVYGERSKALLGAVAKAIESRGWLLRQAAENEKARRNAMGGILIEDLAKRVSDIMHGTTAPRTSSWDEHKDLLLKDEE